MYCKTGPFSMATVVAECFSKLVRAGDWIQRVADCGRHVKGSILPGIVFVMLSMAEFCQMCRIK